MILEPQRSQGVQRFGSQPECKDRIVDESIVLKTGGGGMEWWTNKILRPATGRNVKPLSLFDHDPLFSAAQSVTLSPQMPCWQSASTTVPEGG